MGIAEIIEIETNRKSPEQYGIVHLMKEDNFYRAHDWSAWLMSQFPIGEAVNSPLRISSKKLKDGYIKTWVGFPVTSLGKYVPDNGEVVFSPVSDTQIDVTISLPEEYQNADKRGASRNRVPRLLYQAIQDVYISKDIGTYGNEDIPSRLYESTKGSKICKQLSRYLPTYRILSHSSSPVYEADVPYNRSFRRRYDKTKRQTTVI